MVSERKLHKGKREGREKVATFNKDVNNVNVVHANCFSDCQLALKFKTRHVSRAHSDSSLLPLSLYSFHSLFYSFFFVLSLFGISTLPLDFIVGRCVWFFFAFVEPKQQIYGCNQICTFHLTMEPIK